MMRHSLAVALVWSVHTVAFAQTSPTGAVQSPLPPRQPAAGAVAGTARIRGRVVDVQSGLPLRGVTVAARGDGPRGRSTITDGNGRYEIEALAAGRYSLTADADGYLTLGFGQTRPNQAAKPLPLGEGQMVDNVDFHLPRGGAISGVLRDEQNEPVAGQQVRVVTPTYSEGRKQLTLVGDVQITNDLGEYRIFGLPPGSFYVASTAPGSTSTPENSGAGFAPTYFPNTVNLSEAQRLNLKIGEVVNNIDITLRPAAFASISAMVLDADGRTLTNPILNVRYIGSGISPVLFIPRVESNGSFTVTSLPPGNYELQVTGTSAEKLPLVATSIVSVNGAAQSVQLTATKMAVVSGRVIADASIRSSIASVSISVEETTESLAYQSRRLRFAAPVKPLPDLTFSVTTAARRGLVQVPALPRGWYLQAVRLNGADVTDYGFDIPEGGSVSGVEVVLTARAGELSGMVRGADNQPADDYTVLVFARDPAQRRGLSRYFATARPDATGRFVIRGLPAGEFYAAALEWADVNTSADPAFLETLVGAATSFNLGDAEIRALDLPLIK